MPPKQRVRADGALKAGQAYADGVAVLYGGTGALKAGPAETWGGALNQAGYYAIGTLKAANTNLTGTAEAFASTSAEASGAMKASAATLTATLSTTLPPTEDRTFQTEREIRTFYA